jgi:hypothetical protein
MFFLKVLFLYFSNTHHDEPGVSVLNAHNDGGLLCFLKLLLIGAIEPFCDRRNEATS